MNFAAVSVYAYHMDIYVWINDLTVLAGPFRFGQVLCTEQL